jgi:hypothetical protein
MGTIHEMLTNHQTLPIVLIFGVPILGIIGGTIIVVVKSIIRHRERMAMIQQGLNPDQLRDEDEDASS